MADIMHHPQLLPSILYDYGNPHDHHVDMKNAVAYIHTISIFFLYDIPLIVYNVKIQVYMPILTNSPFWYL